MLVGGALVGMGILPGIGALAAVALSTVLAPTDAALGQAVVTNAEVPLGIRQSLSIESGLNDGMALPVLFTVLAIQLAEDATDPWQVLLEEFGREVGWGVAAGVAVGLLTAGMIRLAERTGLDPSPDAVSVASIGALATTVGLTQALHGSLLIGAFLCGVTAGPSLRRFGDGAFRFGEDLAELLTLLAFVVFGGVILSDELGTLDWRIALYAVLSLAVIRPVTVAISLIGTGDRLPTVLFMGWFGPRGLASILFVATIEQQSPSFGSLDTITSVMTWTVLLSILAHGLSAWPASNRYAAFCDVRAAEMAAGRSMQPLPMTSIMPRRSVLHTRASPR
jgi:NhaP-type Na+/H+ or K+/H+ antiporter